MCNSRFLGSGFLPSYLISFPNVLVGINCLLNCYPVEKMMDFLHYSLSLLFESLDRDRYSCFILFFDVLVSFPSVCFRSFLKVFLF